jgi:hypothetical protein
MIVDCGDLATSAPGEEPLYVAGTAKDGYGFSLTRFSNDPLIELMVEDQTNLPTSSLSAELHADKLVVQVDPLAVKKIGIPSEYIILLSTSKQQMAKIDSALTAIFVGVGHYERRF